MRKVLDLINQGTFETACVGIPHANRFLRCSKISITREKIWCKIVPCPTSPGQPLLILAVTFPANFYTNI